MRDAFKVTPHEQARLRALLVVHRDLKPGNILVTADGQARLLDFGIAKLLDQGPAGETELTQQSGRALTPDYAAPEQILGMPIGTAADVYALGVVLFELLAGKRPYRLGRVKRAALEEAILHADVPRPSTVAPPARRKALRGDLDTIVLKALKKDPSERYATVVALSEDIERHLQQRPVRDNAALRVELLNVIGASLVGLGKLEAAEAVLRQAIDEGMRSLGSVHVLSLHARVTMTSVHRLRGRQEAMRAELDALTTILRALPRAEPKLRQSAAVKRAHLAIDQGRHAEAEAAACEALQIARQMPGPIHAETANAALLVTSALHFSGDSDRALVAADRAARAVPILQRAASSWREAAPDSRWHQAALHGLERARQAARC